MVWVPLPNQPTLVHPWFAPYVTSESCEIERWIGAKGVGISFGEFNELFEMCVHGVSFHSWESNDPWNEQNYLEIVKNGET